MTLTAFPAPLVDVAPGLAVRGLRPPLRLADYRLIAFDMDSTLVAVETLDEMAEIMGCGAEVAALTEAAMRGEIADYRDSLRRRTALMAGMPAARLDELYETRVKLNPGVRELLAACRQAGLRTLLVTSGFTHFTDRLQRDLGLDDVRANVLEVADGRLTGRLLPQPWGELCDGPQKLRKIEETCSAHGFALHEVIAVGDGANDLPMLGAVGLGVGYRPKPAVADRASVVIREGGLDRLLEVVRP